MREGSEIQRTKRLRAAGDSQSFLAAWRWWAIPAALAFALALILVDPFIGDWDGLDYTLSSIAGRPSSMALGRSLFIFTNHAAWRIAHALFGLSSENAYLLFKYMVLVQSPLAVLACWALARELARSREVATIASLLVATSPFFLIYSGQVMTEIPSLLLSALALLFYLRGVSQRRVWLMLAGALVLGAGVNLRETVAFYALWLILAPVACGWKLGRREVTCVSLSIFVFLVAACGPFLYWYWSDFAGYRSAWHGWREAMRVETARHPVSARNALAFFVYFFLASPLVLVALPTAALREWRAHRFSPLLAAALVGLCATMLLMLNYSTTINWRYLLTGLPAFAPLVASYFMRSQMEKLRDARRAFLSVVAGILLIAVVLGFYLSPSRDKFTAQHAMMKTYRERLALVPTDAVLISGSQSIAVTYWRGLGLGRWDVIGAGSGWPEGRLREVIEKNLNENRRVFLDADSRLWPPCGWQASETLEVIELEPSFRFSRVSENLYEVRPATDSSATDAPNLKSLLPENRADEVKRCSGQAKLS